MTKLSGKTIWLVGASSGIGRSLAEKLAEAGNFVIATARNARSLELLKDSYPSHITTIVADVTQSESLRQAEEQLIQTSDSLDLVLLCAGTCEYDDGPSLDSEMYRRIFDVNFFAAVDIIRIALPMLRRAKGRVVGVSSLACVVPFPRAEAYGASKAAFEYMLNSLAIDLKHHAVDVTVVRPGFVKTPLTQRNDFDMPFLMDSDEAADAIISGIAREKRVFAFPWQLSWPINFFSFFKSFWISFIAGSFKKKSQI